MYAGLEKMFAPIDDEPEKPEEPLPRSFSAGEFIGHRAWIVRGLDYIPGLDYLYGERLWLQSFVMVYPWRPGEPVCDTSYDSRKHIEEQNMVGVWAFKNHDDLLSDFISGWTGVEYPIVVGTAWMWGTVIEHTKGYRAQYSTVRSLDKIYAGWSGELNPEEALEKLRELYVKPERIKDTG